MRTLESTRRAIAPKSPSPLTVVGPDLGQQRFIGAAAPLPPLILVADDHEDSRTIARMVLESAGFRVAEAATGREALRLAVALRPIALLLDLVLPELDGWEVARRLRANDATSAAAIIAVTATVLPSDHERARAAGCDMVLTKPVLPTAIVRTVCRYIGLPVPAANHSC